MLILPSLSLIIVVVLVFIMTGIFYFVKRKNLSLTSIKIALSLHIISFMIFILGYIFSSLILSPLDGGWGNVYIFMGAGLISSIVYIIGLITLMIGLFSKRA